MAEVTTVRRERTQADEVRMSVGGADVILREEIQDETLSIELRTSVGYVSLRAHEGGKVTLCYSEGVVVVDDDLRRRLE